MLRRVAYCADMTDSDRSGRLIPVDSFRIRLAIVRTAMGWNYEQAQAATGVGAESWRLWEKGQRHCTDVKEVSRKIAEVTPYDPGWLVMGGPLVPEDQGAVHSPLFGRRRSTLKVRTPSNGEWMSSPRPGRCPVPPGFPINRYRYRFTGNQLAPVAESA